MHDDNEEEGVLLEESVQFLMHRMLFSDIVYTTADAIADCINSSIKVFLFFIIMDKDPHVLHVYGQENRCICSRYKTLSFFR